jgi:uncharacterized protein YndB with AHSA1/START domain
MHDVVFRCCVSVKIAQLCIVGRRKPDKQIKTLTLTIMEHLQYKVVIAAPAKVVWDTMLQKETYIQWVSTAWPNSSYEGQWKKGEKIRFIGPDGSGTLAEIVELKPYERVLAKHIAILGKGGTEDSTSEVAKDWVGITEEYNFTERNGQTEVRVDIGTTPQWRAMFDEGWPVALQDLKRIAERQLSTV